MPICQYCDHAVAEGTTKCNYCGAPRDPSPPPGPPKEQHQQPQQQGQAAQPPRTQAPSGAGAGQVSQGASPDLASLAHKAQSGDLGGVAADLQRMSQSGQLDVQRLAGQLGIGGTQGQGGANLGEIARRLSSSGLSPQQLTQALGQQGDLSSLVKGASQALKSPAGLAVGGVAVAAAGVGAGLLLHRARQGGTAGGLSLGSVLGQGAGGPSTQDKEQYRQAAEQLPPARADQLVEDTIVLARWDAQEWRPGQISWVDGGQARVTFEGGLERWCDPQDIRLPPDQASAGAAATSEPTAGPWAVGERIEAQSGPEAWHPAEITDIDKIGERARVKYENGFECWLEYGQLRRITNPT